MLDQTILRPLPCLVGTPRGYLNFHVSRINLDPILRRLLVQEVTRSLGKALKRDPENLFHQFKQWFNDRPELRFYVPPLVSEKAIRNFHNTIQKLRGVECVEPHLSSDDQDVPLSGNITRLDLERILQLAKITTWSNDARSLPPAIQRHLQAPFAYNVHGYLRATFWKYLSSRPDVNSILDSDDLDRVKDQSFYCLCAVGPFADKEALDEHERTHQEWHCSEPNCAKPPYRTKRQIQRHIRRQHINPQKGIKSGERLSQGLYCSVEDCNRGPYPNKRRLQKHINYMHIIQPVSCPFPQCEGKSFKNKTALESHHGFLHRAFSATCTFPNCDAGEFTIKSRYRSHMRTHTNHQLRCPHEDCPTRLKFPDRRYNNRINLLTHTRLVHLETDYSMCPNPGCSGGPYKTKAALKKHLCGSCRFNTVKTEPS